MSLSSNMPWIAGYYFATGAVVCLSDVENGWRLIKRALLYSYWKHRILCRSRDFGRKPKGPLTNAFNLTTATALGLAIAWPEGIWYLELLERSLSDESLSWFGDDFFTAYLVRLYRKLKRKEDIGGIPPKPQKWEHPFDDLIDCWENEERLGDAILRACDYHFRWNGMDRGTHRAEFGAPVAMVNPIEIHALEAVRAELGLSTPRVEHELLQPPFYPLPEFAKNISTEDILAEDDVLRRIIELNQPWCDGMED
ncbi:MAG: hypothetical protein RBS80_03370 [Thermoguttaceae bacterium]|nr:hypothetical protein [Thermoguttaceae bacterium]